MTDVVIVGAGLAGLSAARALQRAGKQVVVLEARERVGGRTHSIDVGGARLDVGGQWIGPTQHRMVALARALGLATFPTFHEGRKVLELEGRRTQYSGSIPSLPPLGLLDLEVARRMMDWQRQRVPTAAPQAASAARRLDALSVEAWKRRLMRTDSARGVFDAAFRVVFGAEPSEVSALWFLAYCNAGGGFMQLVEVEGAAQEQRFVGGAQGVSEAIAAALGDAVQLNAPVRAISWRDDGATVHIDGTSIETRAVVLAVPPPLVRGIRFDPPLPAVRDQLLQRVPMGATIKCLVRYARPFWRDAGWSGEAVSDGDLLSVTYDNTSHDGGVAALVGFIVGAAARAWSGRGREARERAVLAQLAGWFGPEAATPMMYEDTDWSAEPWSGGCPVSNPAPGVLTTAAATLAQPVGCLHFAGTETATEWTGYMEGAVQSGERAAAEI